MAESEAKTGASGQAVPHWRSDRMVSARQTTGPVKWHVAEEAPVALIYNGLTFAVMLASPSDLKDFVIGFSLTEGIADTPDDISEIDVHERKQGINVAITLVGKKFERLKLRQGRRSLEGRTSCGLCGIDSAERLFEPLPKVADEPVGLTERNVARAVAGLEAMQPLKSLNRSVHGAAWVSGEGELVLVREDVGRHNALDKLLGAMALMDRDQVAGDSADHGTDHGSDHSKKHGAGHNMDLSTGFVLITSRASFEIVEKAARRGVRALVALSAPTAFAIRRAAEANLTLANYSSDRLTLF